MIAAALRTAALAALVSSAATAARAQAARTPESRHTAPVPVVAVGDGRTFQAALVTAIRMAVESGAGATVSGAVAAAGDRLVTDSVRTVSRGVVTRYLVLDSTSSAGVARVRILAMVSRIAERDAAGARAQRVSVPGALWAANASLDADRRADEGALLAELFGAIDRQPSVDAFTVEAGPPVASGSMLRLRLRVIRTPAPAYAALRDRARSLLAAIAGPAGVRTTHLPPLPAEQIEVRPCVSHCGADERRVLNPRAALADPGSLGALDPPVLSEPSTLPVVTLFPDLPTAGGFAVAFTDSARQQLVHVRSTRGYLAVVDYLRTTFDDARVRLDLGERGIDLTESFRAPWTGLPDPRFVSPAEPGEPRVALVQGFRPRTAGGPGASTTLGSPYVVLSLPAAALLRPDTALVDLWLTSAQVARISEVGVAPIATTHRLTTAGCGSARPAAAREPCAPPSAPAAPDVRRAPPPLPLAVLDAIARPPLADGDGAVTVAAGSPQTTVVAVGSATIDAAAPAQACSVARLRAQRELTRFIMGSRLAGRIGLSTAESRGGQVQELFHEDITETVAGRLAGAALAAQWTVLAPPRCRVALWLADGVTVRRDSAGPPPR